MSLEVETGWFLKRVLFVQFLIDGDHLPPAGPSLSWAHACTHPSLVNLLGCKPALNRAETVLMEMMQHDWFPEQQSICFVKALRKKD